MTPDFLAYIFDNQENYQKFAKTYGYTDEVIGQAYGTKESSEAVSYGGALMVEKFANMDIPKEEIERLRKLKKFAPESADTVTLFRVAAKYIDVDESWATNKNLHYILARESGGTVGILNYTISRMTTAQFYQKANSSTSKNPIGGKSTASGLGQLLLSNVDLYYPSGRKGIGDPIEEAIGFLSYIKDRYGSPDVARSVYGKKGYYKHAITGKQMSKNFREGY